MPFCYTEEEVERLFAERMKKIEDGTSVMVSNEDVKTRIRATLKS